MEVEKQLVLVAETPATKQPKVRVEAPVVIGLLEDVFYMEDEDGGGTNIDGVSVTAEDINGEVAILAHVGVDGVLRTYAGVDTVILSGFESVKFNKDGGLRVVRGK